MVTLKTPNIDFLLNDVYESYNQSGNGRMCRECRMIIRDDESILINHVEKNHPKVVTSYEGYGKAHVNEKFLYCFFLKKSGSDKLQCMLCERRFSYSDVLMMENHLRFAHSMEDRQIIAGPTEEEYNLFGLTRQRIPENPQLCMASSKVLPGVKFSPALKDSHVYHLPVKTRPMPSSLSKPSVTNDTMTNNYLVKNKQLAYPLQATYGGTTPEEMKASAAVIQTCFAKDGDSYRCNYCNRLFRKKTDHILICHMRVAHPLVQLKDNGTRPESPPGKDYMTPDICFYFTKVGNRWECVICNVLFGNAKHCAAHMTLKHSDVMTSSNPRPTKPLKINQNYKPAPVITDNNRELKLRRLRYNPSNLSTVTKVNFDCSDPNRLICDYFDNNQDNLQCIICDLMIKTTNIQHLLKHLRMQHAIFHVDDKKFTIGEPQPKRLKPAKIEVPSNATIEGDLFTNYDNPSQYEGDGDYVWNFFEEYKGKLMCICCNCPFTKKTMSSLFKHLQLIHPTVFPNAHEKDLLAEQEYPLHKPPTLYQYRKGKPLKSERSMTTFMINQGVPHDGIYDPNFTHIQHCMSKMASINTPSSFDTVVDELNIDYKRCFVVNAQGPVTASLDFHVDKDNVYMACALHHIEEDNERKNHVFLRKLCGTSIDEAAIKYAIDDCMKSYGYGSARVCSYVYNQKYAPILRKANVKSYNCFYTCVSNFAAAILKLPRYVSALRKLFSFLHKLRNNPLMVTRLELVQKGKGIKIDIYQSQDMPWYQLKDFLEQIIYNRHNFNLLSVFARRWRLEGWIDSEYTEILCSLHKILAKLCYFASCASNPYGILSCVVPTILDILHAFKSIITNDMLLRELTNLHTEHFQCFFEGVCDNRYDITLYLDPRYVHLPTIYNETKWEDVSTRVKEMLMQETDIEKELIDEDFDKQITKSLAQLNKDISREMNAYTKITATNRPSFGNRFIMEWWYEQRQVFPILYLKALEFFTVPMCTMDADSLFGQHGKFARMESVVSYHQLSSMLQVVSRSEPFRGRGFSAKQLKNESDEIERLEKSNEASTSSSSSNVLNEGTSTAVERAPPMPSRIAGLACARPQPPGHEGPKLTKYEIKKMAMRENLTPARFIREEPDNFNIEDMLMMPPPPVLESMVEQHYPSSTVVKMEVEEEKKPEIGNIQLANSLQSAKEERIEKRSPTGVTVVPKTESSLTAAKVVKKIPEVNKVKEVKEEVVDPEFEKVATNEKVKQEEPDDY